jgi:hypothetical protein
MAATTALLVETKYPLSHYQRQHRVFFLGGVIYMLSYVVQSVASVVTSGYSKQPALNGQLVLVQALLQTIGAMVVAAIDADLDLFAKKNPRSVLAFAIMWIAEKAVAALLPPPIVAVRQSYWLAALPFVHLLIRFEKRYPCFSDLLVYSFALDLGSLGVHSFLQAANLGPVKHLRTWPWDIIGTLYVLGGALVLGIYWYFRSTHSSRRLALSITLYAYLLAYGITNLADVMVGQYVNDKPTPFIQYSFAIIHITFPLAYFAFRPLIYPHLGRHWLEQRSGWIPLKSTVATRGNIVEVEAAIMANADLNDFMYSTEDEDEFTLLHLAVLNEHYDSIQRLLLTGDVHTNQPSSTKGRTALFLAAELGLLHAMVLLIEHSADVDMPADDNQTPLIVATANGHLKVAKLLRDNGANEVHKWMRLNGACFITFCRTL